MHPIGACVTVVNSRPERDLPPSVNSRPKLTHLRASRSDPPPVGSVTLRPHAPLRPLNAAYSRWSRSTTSKRLPSVQGIGHRHADGSRLYKLMAHCRRPRFSQSRRCCSPLSRRLAIHKFNIFSQAILPFWLPLLSTSWTILDSHIMTGVAPGRETESGGFADVDRAGRGGFRVGSAHFFASALTVSLRRRTRTLRTRNEWVRRSIVSPSHATEIEWRHGVRRVTSPTRPRRSAPDASRYPRSCGRTACTLVPPRRWASPTSDSLEPNAVPRDDIAIGACEPCARP
jgi:hypothetical protein